MGDVIKITVRLAEGVLLSVDGRLAWTLHALIEHGEAGVTPLTWVGPRWSDYVMKLRRRGIVIETVGENHGGPFAGRHGRYVLRSPLIVVETVRAGDRASGRAA